MCIAVLIHMDALQFRIQPSSAEPIYRQIADQLRRLVASGQVTEGTMLPSVRDMAAAHVINPMTVSKAYSLLESEGMLERLRGKGMVISAQVRRSQPVTERLRQIEPALAAVVQQTHDLELPTATVLTHLQSMLEKDA